jgi:hypothetical protein
MKGLLYSSAIFFALAIIFRLYHLPFGSLLPIISCSLLFIFAVINNIRAKQLGSLSAFGGWVLFAWSFYILFKYMYWNMGLFILGFSVFFLLVFALTILYVITNAKRWSKGVLIVSILGLVYSFVPAYVSCYFFDLNEVINKEYNEINYASWDQYSWFLFQSGKNEEALEANQQAMKACQKAGEVNRLSESEMKEITGRLSQHKEAINGATDIWSGGFSR